MEVKDNRLIRGKQAFKFSVSHAMRVLSMGQKLEQVHDVHESHFHIRKVLAQQSGCRQRLQHSALISPANPRASHQCDR
jgi:hypothetical protein